MSYQSTKVLNLGSCAFRQPNAAFNRQDAGKNSARCSKLHGYRLKAKFWFGCSELDDKNWVQDFGGFGPIKELFEHQFDHTTCLDASDPLLHLFKEIENQGGLDLRVMPNGTGIERIAEFCYVNMQEFVNKQSNGRVWVNKVEVFEHEDNSAIFLPHQVVEEVNSKPQTEAQLVEEVQQLVHEEMSKPAPNQGARVGNHTTPGMSNLFGGTSWGR
jgi:6-pyruvoyltetrahydropterin/6-carboxytetrahydropterin synthase